MFRTAYWLDGYAPGAVTAAGYRLEPFPWSSRQVLKPLFRQRPEAVLPRMPMRITVTPAIGEFWQAREPGLDMRGSIMRLEIGMAGEKNLGEDEMPGGVAALLEEVEQVVRLGAYLRHERTA